MSPLIVNTVLIPLGLGLILGLALGRKSGPNWLNPVLAGAAVLAVYVLLEGVPHLPPVSAKQKLFPLICAALPVSCLALAPGVMTPSARVLRRAVIPAYLMLTLLWFGLTKLTQGAGSAQAVWLLLAPVAASLWSQPQTCGTAPSQSYLWPAALLVYAVNMAVLSLFGGFVGFAQVLGAQAALLGGALLIRYLTERLGKDPAVFSTATLNVFLMTLCATALLVGLFAPKISLPAFALSALVLCVPAVVPRLQTWPAALRPFAFGVMAAAPAAASILAATSLVH